MSNLMELWLPILVSAAIVFVASSIIWMALPIHKNDYKGAAAAEGPLLDTLRAAALKPGVYMLPWCNGGKDNAEATKAKMAAGPWAMIYVMKGNCGMGRTLGLWFVHLVIVGVFVAYVASHANLGPAPHYLSVFRVVGAAALLAHAGYALPMCIWHAHPWSLLPGKLFDAVVYSLLTAGTFAWLWPKAAAAIPALQG